MRRQSGFSALIVAGLALLSATTTAGAQTPSPAGCQEIAVVGALKAPGQFKFESRLRLLDALKLAAGPTERAGKIVRVIQSCKCMPCNEDKPRAADGVAYELSTAMSGRDDANPLLAPGDIVIVPEGEIVFVTVNGSRRQPIVYREGLRLTSVLSAIGIAVNSELMKVKIHHPRTTQQKYGFEVFTLKEVREGRIEDPLLRPWDMLEISDEQGRFHPGLNYPIRDTPLFPRKSSDS